MQNNAEFVHLKRIMATFDWLPITEILGKRRYSRRGRKKEFLPVSLFRVFLLKSYLLLDDNTLIARRLSENKEYLSFCGLTRVPSHDVLNDFENNYSHRFMSIFEFLDDLLEKSGAFEEDDMSFDGTDIPVPMKNEQSPHRYHFGANSNQKKFHGFWLMILASVKHQLPRRFIVGYGREGQINLAKELIMYAGLCPGVFQTGNIERNVPNQAVNKWLKWIIGECSGRAAIMQNRFQEHYAKIKQRKGFKVARRSTARKMLTIIWHMLHNEEPYRHAS